ncbi:hypothetical protein QU481_20505 [Crenobacter sp. SG2303]|uniref:Uncharacterized protein n=1 Tax=Crenobacter oryzisoli TaxID=3056844 RepID=A0ABT7XTW9_9NEIS|nr:MULTISPECIES: hypothetical protein [unclassified Crenobacter]MDN0077227.1 hypothetical protein [Crenobacter sp. SG2303]MDN0084732.1 hypothetical protein [Crenobacter sp. SG2305]
MTLDDIGEASGADLRRLQDGYLTLLDSIRICERWRRIEVPVSELFPPDPVVLAIVRARCALLVGLYEVLVRFNRAGIPASTCLVDIPLLRDTLSEATMEANLGKFVSLR